MKYVYATPELLKQNWDFVKLGLNHILRKSPESWIVEDIYARCLYKNAYLWLVLDDNESNKGFFVLENNGDTCHVWCAWAVDPDMLIGGTEFIEKLAREAGAKRITFDTNRAGWVKVAKQLGFIPRTWAKELR